MPGRAWVRPPYESDSGQKVVRWKYGIQRHSDAKCPSLRADEACIERARNRDICCALHDRAPVCKDRYGMRTAAEAQQQIVTAQIGDVRIGGETSAHGGKVDRAMVLM